MPSTARGATGGTWVLPDSCSLGSRMHQPHLMCPDSTPAPRPHLYLSAAAAAAEAVQSLPPGHAPRKQSSIQLTGRPQEPGRLGPTTLPARAETRLKSMGSRGHCSTSDARGERPPDTRDTEWWSLPRAERWSGQQGTHLAIKGILSVQVPAPHHVAPGRGLSLNGSGSPEC